MREIVTDTTEGINTTFTWGDFTDGMNATNTLEHSTEEINSDISLEDSTEEINSNIGLEEDNNSEDYIEKMSGEMRDSYSDSESSPIGPLTTSTNDYVMESDNLSSTLNTDITTESSDVFDLTTKPRSFKPRWITKTKINNSQKFVQYSKDSTQAGNNAPQINVKYCITMLLPLVLASLL